MAKETPAQQRTVGRVMHAFRQGELESGPEGKAGQVTDARQAIAIALSEAGVSNRTPPARNRRDRASIKATDASSAPARSRSQLHAEARKRGVPGRSTMSKAELERVLKS